MSDESLTDEQLAALRTALARDDWALGEVDAGRYTVERYTVESGVEALAVTVGDDSDPRSVDVLLDPDDDGGTGFDSFTGEWPGQGDPDHN